MAQCAKCGSGLPEGDEYCRTCAPKPEPADMRAAGGRRATLAGRSAGGLAPRPSQQTYPMLNLMFGLVLVAAGLLATMSAAFLGFAEQFTPFMPIGRIILALGSGGAVVVVGAGLLRLRTWAWWLGVALLSLSVLSHLMLVAQTGSFGAPWTYPPFWAQESPFGGAGIVIQLERPYFVGLWTAQPLASLLAQAAALVYYLAHRQTFSARH